jgi:hypothetical protein
MDDTPELRRLEAAATEGPWTRGRLRRECDGQFVHVFCDEVDITPPLGESGPVAIVHSAEDGDLIAAMRNALPGLLNRITELETALKLSMRQADPAEFVFACQGAELHRAKQRITELESALQAVADARQLEAEYDAHDLVCIYAGAGGCGTCGDFHCRIEAAWEKVDSEPAWDALRKARGKSDSVTDGSSQSPPSDPARSS